MGIFTFASAWVLKKFGRTLVVQDYIPSDVSSLVIDMNGTIHRALQKVYHYGDFDDPVLHDIAIATPWNEMKFKVFNMIMSELDDIIERIMPRETLVIAIDGPTNVAKMQQQRTRRYRSAFHSSDKSFDTSIVTPGTDFMFELDELIRRELIDRRSKYPPTVIYSSHMVNGEGEHKLMEMYRANQILGDDRHVIYGLDADLILLSLISPQKNVVLVREDRRKILNIELLRQELIGFAPPNLKETAIIDFIILMTLVGNDFIPHGPLHHSMFHLVEGLLGAYYELNTPLSIKNDDIYTVNLPALGMIVKKMHELQAERLAYETMNPNFREDQPAMYNRFNQGALRMDGEEVVFDFDSFRSIWYTNAFGCNNGGNPINDDYGKEDIDDMCQSYVEGIIWCTRYYQSKDVDQKWVYRYFHAPLFIDLAEYLMKLSPSYGPSLDNEFHIEYNLEWDALVQLACVIPITNKTFPLGLGNINQLIPDMFPSQIVFESDGFDEVRNFVVIMPIITIDRIMAAVDRSNVVGRLKWRSAQDILIASTEAQQDAYMTWYTQQIYTNQFIESKQKMYQKRSELTRIANKGEGGGRSRGGRDGGRGRGNGRGGRGRGLIAKPGEIIIIAGSSKSDSSKTHGRFI